MQNTASGKTEKQRQQRNRLYRLRPMLRWVVKLRSSPEAIAGGLGLGTFISFTPTVGVQFIIVVILATLLKLNRAASIAPIWITNPVTITPVYTFNYWVGLQFCDGPPLRQVSGIFVEIGKAMAKMEIWQIKEQIEMMLHIGKNVIFPLFIGSCIVGIICGVIVYIFSRKMLIIFFSRRAQRRRNKK